MLSTMRTSWALYSLLALTTLSSALSVDDVVHIDGIEAYLHNGVKRQAEGTGNTQAPTAAPTTTDAAPTTTDAPTTDAPTTDAPTTDAPTATPTTDQNPATTTTANNNNNDDTTIANAPASTAAPTSQAATSAGSRPTSAAGNGGSSADGETAADTKTSTKVTTPVTKTTPLLSTSVGVYTTVYTTKSNGQDVVMSTTGTTQAVITTGQAVTTELPGTQADDSTGGHGMSDKNKSIIGGVVGGVGGAVLLGGIAIVLWRIWGKKKRVSEDDDDLMAGTGSALGDKQPSNASPFQSNLEQYHNPGGRPNAAANF